MGLRDADEGLGGISSDVASPMKGWKVYLALSRPLMVQMKGLEGMSSDVASPNDADEGIGRYV